MFKFVFSCQPLYYYIHKVLKRCPTERYIKPVRIPGYCGLKLLRDEIVDHDTIQCIFTIACCRSSKNEKFAINNLCSVVFSGLRHSFQKLGSVRRS